MGESFLSFKKSKGICCAIILGLVLTLFQGPFLVHASSGKTVKIGYYENELFEEGAHENAVKSGYAYEYYIKLSEYTGWNYEYVYGSFNDLYQKLIDGEIDLLAGLAYVDERTEFMSYPEQSMGSESYNLIKHESDDTITADISTIKGHTIGVLDSALADAIKDYLITHNIKATVLLYRSTEELQSDFEENKIDMMATEGSGTTYRKDYDVFLTFGLSDFYICVNKQKPELLQELNIAQEALFNDEPYYRSALSSKYFTSSVSTKAFTDAEKKWLAEHDSVSVGYLKNYLPYSDMDESGNPIGLINDVLTRIFDVLNIDDKNVSYVGYDSYDDMMAALNAEEIDTAFPVGGGFYFSEENGIYQSNAFVSSSTNLIYEKVVVNPDTATFAVNSKNNMQYYYIKSNYPNAKIKYYDSIEKCLEAVLDNEVNCTTLNGLRSNEILKNAKYNKLTARQLSIKDERGFGVKKGNEGLIRLINRGIHILGEDYVENLAYKYTEALYSYSRNDWVCENLVIFSGALVLVAIIVLAFFIYHLKALRIKLRSLEAAKSNQATFIDNISKFIRKPIGEISDISKMAIQVMDDEDLVVDSLKRISDSSGRIASDLDRIVDMNLLNKKKLSLKEDRVNVVELSKEIESKMLPIADKKGVTMVVEAWDIKNKDIIIDGDRLRQILEYTIDNSIKYTSKGGHVWFSICEKPCTNPGIAKLNFTIKDDGVGMSEEFASIVFTEFAKEKPQPEENEGLGLGLPIAKKLVELMGGTMKLQSNKGTGSEIEICIDCKNNYKPV